MLKIIFRLLSTRSLSLRLGFKSVFGDIWTCQGHRCRMRDTTVPGISQQYSFDQSLMYLCGYTSVCLAKAHDKVYVGFCALQWLHMSCEMTDDASSGVKFAGTNLPVNFL